MSVPIWIAKFKKHHRKIRKQYKTTNKTNMSKSAVYELCVGTH